MESPLIVALSRQMAVYNQMSVLADNIANMSTNAYKAERPMFRQYIARTDQGDVVHFPQENGLHREMRAGPIERTANELDVALRGDGYLTVETAQGTRYTRNGHLSLNSDGELVTSRGQRILNTADQPIVVPTDTRKITISKDGIVSGDEQNLGQIKLVTFDNFQRLKRAGEGLYVTDAPPQRARNLELLQGHLEGSNVVPIIEMTQFMKAVGAYQSAKQIIDQEHERQRSAIERLGGVPQ